MVLEMTKKLESFLNSLQFSSSKHEKHSLHKLFSYRLENFFVKDVFLLELCLLN